VVIDEIGPLELRGNGWTASVDLLMEHPEITHIWVVRKNLVKDVIKKWQILDVHVFDIAADEVADVARQILNS
jgi:nucleoside-triphosphatase THEP1